MKGGKRMANKNKRVEKSKVMRERLYSKGQSAFEKGKEKKKKKSKKGGGGRKARGS